MDSIVRPGSAAAIQQLASGVIGRCCGGGLQRVGRAISTVVAPKRPHSRMTMPAKVRSYYDVLHVSQDAPMEIIRASYRALMQRLRNHPDLGGDGGTASLINEAYSALADAGRRAQYDALLNMVRPNGWGEKRGFQRHHPAPLNYRPPDPWHQCVFCGSAHGNGSVIDVDAACTVCASPLYPADNRRLEFTSQRAVTRIDQLRDIVFYTHWPQSTGFVARTENVSLNGLRFTTSEKLAEGQQIKIVSGFVEGVAGVTYCGHKRRGFRFWHVVGVSFTTIRFVSAVGVFVSHRV